MTDDFLLPHEVFDATGVPADARDRVQAIILSAKYCALVEAVMKLTGGEPITVDLRRVQQIADQTQRTDPRDVVMVQEVALDDEALIAVSLADLETIQQCNRRYALSRMGPSRN